MEKSILSVVASYLHSLSLYADNTYSEEQKGSSLHVYRNMGPKLCYVPSKKCGGSDWLGGAAVLSNE